MLFDSRPPHDTDLPSSSTMLQGFIHATFYRSSTFALLVSCMAFVIVWLSIFFLAWAEPAVA